MIERLSRDKACQALGTENALGKCSLLLTTLFTRKFGQEQPLSLRGGARRSSAVTTSAPGVGVQGSARGGGLETGWCRR